MASQVLAIPGEPAAVVDVFAGFADTTTSSEYKEGAEQLQSQSVNVSTFLAWVLDSSPLVFQEKSSTEQTLLHVAVIFQAPKPCVDAVLSACPDSATVKDEDGRTPLHYALVDRCTGTVQSPLSRLWLERNNHRNPPPD